jgi:hypothetical protein
MTTISSLQAELSSWNDKSETASNDAKKHRVNAANYNANGYADKAQLENNAAIDKDNQSADFAAKAQEVTSKIQSMEYEVSQLESQIQALQDKLVRITG